MEYVDSSWNSGGTATAGYSPNQKDINHTLLNEDDFQCTFFRQSKRKIKSGACHSRWSDENSISFNLSDTCTDSESEFDEQVHSTPYLPTNSSGTYTNDDHISKPDGKAFDAPRVTFNQTLYIHSDRSLKPCLQKGSMRREIENGFTQIVRLTKKRNCLREKNDPKNNYCTRFCTSRFPTKCEKQITFKDKMFLEERMKNSRNVQSGVQSILRGTKRSYDPTSIVQDDRSICKRKKLIENRIVKNRRLLKSVAEVIREMSIQIPLRMDFDSIQSIKNTIAETDLTRLEGEKIQVKKPEKVESSQATKVELQRPIFKKANVEKLLDDSMREAVKKYRACRNTWDSIKKEQFIKA